MNRTRMNRTRSFDELKDSLEDCGFILTQPKHRYFLEHTEGEDFWTFDNLDEVRSVVAGFEISLEFMTP